MVDGWTVPGFTHVKELGRGASGRVMLAVDDVTRTEVAIKYLDERLWSDASWMQRYRAVARRMTQVEDEAIADLYDLVEGPGGAGAVVMQLARGISLRRMLDVQGPTGPLAALAVFGGSLAALGAAHQAEVVHQDFKPGNVLVEPTGEILVTDFGIVPPRAFGDEPPGTPAYAAPELWDGAPASPASDLYAATVVFYECLTGRRPFDAAGNGGKALAALAKAHREAPIPADAVPGPLRGLILAGLAKDPGDRPGSAEDFLAMLEEAAVSAYGPSWEAQGAGRLTDMVTATLSAPPPARPEPAGIARSAAPAAGLRSRRLLVGAAGAVAAIALAGGAVHVLSGGQDRPGGQDVLLPTAAAEGPRPDLSPTPGPGAALAARIERTAARHPSASFSFRRSGCCGAAVTAKGRFRLVSGGEPAYSMLVSSSDPQTRRTARTILIDDTAYVRTGASWQPVPSAGAQTQGYAPLAAGVRGGTSVANVAKLVQGSTSLRQVGRTYRGVVPMAALVDEPLYNDLTRATGAKRAVFALALDSSGLPHRLHVTVGSGDKAVTLRTAYARWGQPVSITAPR